MIWILLELNVNIWLLKSQKLNNNNNNNCTETKRTNPLNDEFAQSYCASIVTYDGSIKFTSSHNQFPVPTVKQSKKYLMDPTEVSNLAFEETGHF